MRYEAALEISLKALRTLHRNNISDEIAGTALNDIQDVLGAQIDGKDINGELIDALKGVIRVADRKTVEFDAARTAIANAEKAALTAAPQSADISQDPDTVFMHKSVAEKLVAPPGFVLVPREPEKIMQTVLGNNGNCMSACLASLMGLSIEEMPNFFDMGKTETQWWNGLRKWLEQYNLGIVTVDMKGAWLASQKGYFIVGGESVRGLHHAVLYKDGQLWHDPHPDQHGIIEPAGVDILYALNPLLPTGKAFLTAAPSPPQSGEDAGYVDAFYKIAGLLKIGAKPYSPKEAFERDILPAIEKLIKSQASPPHEDEIPGLDEAIENPRENPSHMMYYAQRFPDSDEAKILEAARRYAAQRKGK